MFSRFVCFSLLAYGAAGTAASGQCLVDSGEAVSDALDASLFVWASYKRCGAVGKEVNCAIDVSSAVKSVNSMINVILKVSDKCHALHSANRKCGLAAGRLTEHMAGLSAAAAELVKRCPIQGPVTPVTPTTPAHATSPVLCTVDLKDTAKGLFDAIQALKQNQEDCKGKEGTAKCNANILDIVGSFAGMGQYLSGTVGQCRSSVAARTGAAAADTTIELCAQASAAVLEYTLKIAENGVQLSDACKPEEAPAPETIKEVVAEIQVHRLYEKGEKPDDAMLGMSNHTLNFVLCALMPATAIVSFVGGRFFSQRRASAQASREYLSAEE